MDQNQVNAIVDKIISTASELKVDSGKVFDNEKLSALKDRENKWHEISMNQLSFYNNLLIVLGTGFLAFVVKEFKPTNIYFSLSEMKWHPTVIVLSIACMTGATFFGLLCGFNRLVDFRYTHRVNNLRRKLYKKNFANYGNGNYTEKISLSFCYWFKDAKFFTVTDNEYDGTANTVKSKIAGCSKLIDQLGKFTRNLLRMQIMLFLLAVLFFSLSFK